MIHTDSFDFHVDAKYFNFMWKEPMYITATYTANIEDNEVKDVSIQSVTGSPVLIGSIVLHENWFNIDVAMIAAAKDHAEKQIAGRVHPTKLGTTRHFIRP